ncbi:MAG: hypothetical protein EXQ88_00100 [Alphaproteobacteria bacterium]|nr:hypothetical protein [Alphaproteobacteria bacterium]
MQGSCLSRFIALLLIVVAGGAVAGCTTSDDLGAEFVEIKAEESQLSFTLPAVAGGAQRYFKGRDRTRGHTVYTASWRPARSEFPSAQLNLLNAPPGYYFGYSDLDTDLIRGWSNFRERPFTIDERTTRVSGLGRFTVHRFHSDNLSCVAFAIVFGNHDRGDGTRRLDGLYCLQPGDVLTPATVESVLAAVKVNN